MSEIHMFTELDEKENGIVNEMRKEAVGLWNTEKMLADTLYAGTGTKEEVMEVTRHIRDLVSMGMMSFYELEKHLLSNGYTQRLIRDQFRAVTGISVEDIDAENQLARKTPVGVPGVNLGWGPMKGKEKAHFLFIMPWLTGYGVFKQLDCKTREQVKQFPGSATALNEARDYVKSHCGEYHEFNKPVEIKPAKLSDIKDATPAMNEPHYQEIKAALSPAAGQILDFMVSNSWSGQEGVLRKNALLDSCFNTDEITASDYKFLKAFILRTAAPEGDAAGLVAVETDRPEIAKMFDNAKEGLDRLDVTSEMQEATPQDFMENMTSEKGEHAISEAVRAIEHYFSQRGDVLNGKFGFKIKSFKYFKLNPDMAMEQNVDVNSDRLVEFLNSSASVAILIDIFPASATSDFTPKTGLMTFLVIGGKYFTKGTFKGVDTKKKYAFDKDGIEAYFHDAGISAK